jgi:hypothetical protein
MLAAVRGESRSWWRRPWIWTIPAAAAAAILLILDPFRGGGKQAGGVPGTLVASGRKAVAAEREHEPTLHGELLGWTGVKYDELVDGLPDGAVLTAANLKSAVPPYRALAPLEEFQKAVKSKLGSSFSLPKEFLAGGRVVGGEVLEWHGGWIPQVIVEYGDRELALYEISKCQSEQFGMCFQRLLPSLHSVERDTGRQVRIDACKGCDAILVLRKGRAYILISRHGRDWDDGWMLDRARRLLD